jgi:hypothetical protein
MQRELIRNSQCRRPRTNLTISRMTKNSAAGRSLSVFFKSKIYRAGGPSLRGKGGPLNMSWHFSPGHLAGLPMPARSTVCGGACSEAAVARVFTCFRRVFVPQPGRKEARAPRTPHRRRWRPCAPTRVPRPYWRIPTSKIRQCVLWSRRTVRR